MKKGYMGKLLADLRSSTQPFSREKAGMVFLTEGIPPHSVWKLQVSAGWGELPTEVFTQG